jgi:rod shape determining protein RodA
LSASKSTIQPASEPPPPLVPREWRLRLDPLLLLATLGLVAASLVSLNGATENDIPGQPHYYVYRQAVYAAIGLVLMYGASRLDYSRLRELRYPIYGLMIGLVLIVLVIATATRGAKAWIPLPGFNFQWSTGCAPWGARRPRGSCCSG